MRYAPAHALAHGLIQAGAIGEIVGIQIQTLIDKALRIGSQVIAEDRSTPGEASRPRPAVVSF